MRRRKRGMSGRGLPLTLICSVEKVLGILEYHQIVGDHSQVAFAYLGG